MNLVLFWPDELTRPLPTRDPRAIHILTVLRTATGETLDVGVVNGPRGKATVESVDETAIHLSFALDVDTPPLPPITLLVGVPRPVAAQRILREATTLGVHRMIFCGTEKGEASYLSAGLWRDRRFEQFLTAGAQQAFDTRLPQVLVTGSVEGALDLLPPARGNLVALDNYEATVRLGRWKPLGRTPAVLAVGPERGWSGAERDALRERGFTLAGLGDRVLRTETACLAGLALLLLAYE